MAGEGSRFLEAASAAGQKAWPKVSKIDPVDPPLTTSQPISQRARLACTRLYSLKRLTCSSAERWNPVLGHRGKVRKVSRSVFWKKAMSYFSVARNMRSQVS